MNPQPIIILLTLALQLLKISPHDPSTLALVNDAVTEANQYVAIQEPIPAPVEPQETFSGVSPIISVPDGLGVATATISDCPSPDVLGAWNSFANQWNEGDFLQQDNQAVTWHEEHNKLPPLTNDEAIACGVVLTN